MIRTRTFDWAVHGPQGPGWLVTGAPAGWYPGGGFLAAHDTIEHLSNKPDWAHELRAAGVAAFDVSGMADRSYESIAVDVTGFASKDHNFTAPKAPARWSKPLKPRDEQVVQALARELQAKIDEGLRRLAADRYARDAAPKEAVRNAPHFVANALPWIRLGYAVAKRVYDGRIETGQLIERVREAINSDHNRMPPVTGDRLVVRVDTKAKTFTIARSGNESLKLRERLTRSFSDELFGGLFPA